MNAPATDADYPDVIAITEYNAKQRRAKIAPGRHWTS